MRELARGRLAADVVGHERARLAFERALSRHRIAHAYLLVGPEGVGKRRFARGVARRLLCARPAGGAPCGTCASCRTFDGDNHPGVESLIAEGGGNIEIDRVRAVITALSVRTGERRVVIVDPADALQAAAANALLKTLEEPPPGIVFLLVTQRPAAILDTIHSRCHRVPFAGLDRDDFARVLASLNLEEEIDGELIERLWLACSGSPGQALRLLEGIAACGGRSRFEDLLAGVGAERPESLVDYLPAATPKETKRARVRRLLELVLDGTWGGRAGDPDARQRAAACSLEIAELQRGLERNNWNADLVLERLARILREGVSR